MEGRRLSDEDAVRLRVSYAVQEGSFALRLMGKDGGVKRRDEDIVPIDTLYDQIDSMPMRQQEMRQ